MRKELFLWGAPCLEVAHERQILELKGYRVRTMADEAFGYDRLAPRDRLQQRACAMLECAAVVIDTTTKGAELRRCLDQCKAMGVRCVFTHELPATPPKGPGYFEMLDSIDRTHSTNTTIPA